MNDIEHASGISRRTVLGGLGAGLGAGAGLLALDGHPVAAGGNVPYTALAGLPMVATPLQAGLRYIVTCGHDLIPIDEQTKYTTVNGQFRYTASPYVTAWASVRTNLPVGAVIKELEMYGTRSAVAGTARLELWKSTVATGAVVSTAGVNVPAAVGVFTVTVAANDAQTVESKSTPFAYIDAAAAPNTTIFGIRIGYVAPSVFNPLPTSTPPRIYDTRLPGGTKLAPNEERTITLPVPPLTTAVITVTLTNTESGGGYVSVFPAGIAWPGNSSVNFSGPNQDVANTVVTAVSADSKITIRGGANKTDVIVDVTGWV